MKKILRSIFIVILTILLTLTLVSCDRAPGLYNWLGIKMNVDYMLKLTLDVGTGEKEYLVPFDLYRDLFVYFKTRISDLVPVDNDNNNAKLATTEEQNKALKEFTEEQIVEYYCLYALCEEYGVGIGDDNGELYQQEYDKQVKSYAEKVTDEDLKDFKGTKLDYANKLYEENIEKLGMTKEYFKHTFYKSLLEKRLKMVLVPDLHSYITQAYSHFREVYVEYTIGDSKSESDAYKKINEAYAELVSGANIEDLTEKYNNNVLYQDDIIIDMSGNILGSQSNSTVNGIIIELLSSLNPDEYSEIISGEGDDNETGYYAIIYKLDFDNDLIYGSNTKSNMLFQFSYVGATSYSSYYTQYRDLIEAYSQNMRIEVYDKSVYDRVSVKTLF